MTPWRSIVEEALILLKGGSIKEAISALEGLLETVTAVPAIEVKSISMPEKETTKVSPRRLRKSRKNSDALKISKTSDSKLKSPRSRKSRRAATDPPELSKPVKHKKELSSSITEPKNKTTEVTKPNESPNELLRSEKQQKAWKYIVNELYSTERDYIRDLHTIIEVYREPMLEKKIISPDEATKLFSNISMILTVNSELLKQLESIDSGPETKASSSFHAPANKTIDELKAMKGIMNVSMTSVGGTEIKTISVDGFTTFRQALDRLLRKMPQNSADAYQLYHENELIENLKESVLAHVDYDMTKLNFSYKRDALKKAQTVGGAILSMAHYLKIYAEYCSNQSLAFNLLNQFTKEREGMEGFLKNTFKNRRCRKLDLNSFLVLPLQRVCKYPLLLRELISQTPVGHLDYEPLKQASLLIGSTVITINEKQREAEEQLVMINLQNNLDGLKKGETILSPARRFLSKGNLNFINKKSEDISAEFYLFSDILLFCTEENCESGRCRLLDILKMKNAFVEDRGELAFAVGNLGKQKKIVLSCNSEREKKKVTEVIQKKIMKDAFDEWRNEQSSSVNITFAEWYNLYGKILFG